MPVSTSATGTTMGTMPPATKAATALATPRQTHQATRPTTRMAWVSAPTTAGWACQAKATGATLTTVTLTVTARTVAAFPATSQVPKPTVRLMRMTAPTMAAIRTGTTTTTGAGQRPSLEGSMRAQIATLAVTTATMETETLLQVSFFFDICCLHMCQSSNLACSLLPSVCCSSFDMSLL